MKQNQIYQGDCLELMKEIENNSINMILCDLPYGTTSCKWDIIIPFDKLWEQYKRIIKDNGAIILTSTQPFTTDLINSNRKMFRYELIWNRIRVVGFLNANRMPLKCHENILVFYKKLPTFNPIMETGTPYNKTKYNNRKSETKVLGDFITKGKKNEGLRFPKSILKISQGFSRQQQIHPTQKPVELFEYLIKTYTNEKDLVLDNCIGSGTTAIACMNTKRNFIGIELEQKYIDIANKRLKDWRTKQNENSTRRIRIFY